MKFLENPNFLIGQARKEKVIESLHFLQRSRSLKLYEDRPEIMGAVRSLALNHNALASLTPQTFVTTFIYSTMKMKIEDPEVWSSLASYVSKTYKTMDIRSLSNTVYAFQKVSQGKPIILNFDDLFTDLELPIIMKLDQSLPGSVGDPQSISNFVLAYAKSQNGSTQFF